MPEAEIKTFFRSLWHRKFLIMATGAIIFAVVAVYTFWVQPAYRATATLSLERLDDFSISNSGFTKRYLAEIFLTNRIEEIRSRRMAEAVVAAMPRLPLLHLKNGLEALSEEERLNAIIDNVQKSVGISPILNSDILKISAESNAPEVAAAIANIYAQQYVEYYVTKKREGVSGARSFLDEQTTIYKDKLETAEIALAEFKETHEISVLDRQAAEVLNRYTGAEALYNVTKAEIGAKENRLSSLLKNIATERKELVPSLTSVASPWAEKLKERLVQLELDYTELQLQEYAPNHPRMVQLREKINQTKESLTSKAIALAQGDGVLDTYTQLQDYLKESLTLQIELEAMKAKLSEVENTLSQYDTALKGVPAQELQLARLERDKRVNEQTYLMLQQKKEEARISEAEKVTSIRIIDSAEIPLIPIRPRKKLNLLLGLLLGGACGVALALTREYFNDVIKSTDDVKDGVNLRVLATIPKIANGISQSENGMPVLANWNGSNGRNGNGRLVPAQISDDHYPDSRQYHILRTNLQMQSKKENLGNLLVTSVGPEEGKSTTAINLALSMANTGKKTLLVDMDFHRPRLHRVFGIGQKPGLIGVLRALESAESSIVEKGPQPDRAVQSRFSVAMDQAIMTFKYKDVEKLHVLPAGSIDGKQIPYFNTRTIDYALKLFRSLFDVVVIDGPPVLLVPEALVTSSLADGVLFVVEYSRTKKEGLEKISNLLKNASANTLGVVINKANLKKMNGDAHYYGYY